MKLGQILKFFLSIPLLWILFFSHAVAEPLRVLVFGDSLAAGYGLPEKEGFCPQLQAQLAELGIETEIINAGVSGDTSYGALARADQTYGVAHDVVILEIGANDMLRGLPPKGTRENIAALIEKSDKPVYLLGMRAMPTFGSVYSANFDTIYPDLAQEYDTGLYPFIFQPIFAQGIEKVWAYFQPDFMHPNGAGVALTIDDLAPKFATWLEQEALALE